MAGLRRSGLSRHIIVSMSLMVIGVIVMMILSSWLLYAVLVEFFPGSAEEPESWLPTGPELAWMVGVILTGWHWPSPPRSALPTASCRR